MRGKAPCPLIPEHGDFSFSEQCSVGISTSGALSSQVRGRFFVPGGIQ